MNDKKEQKEQEKSIKIQKANDISNSAGKMIAIIGSTGIGKTTCAAMADDSDKVLVLDSEISLGTSHLSTHNLNPDVIHLTEFPEKQQINEIVETVDKYSCVVIDSINELSKLAEEKIIKTRSTKHVQYDGSLSLAGHGLKNMFIVGIIREITKKGTDVIITCSVNVSDDEHREVTPILSAGIQKAILPLCNATLLLATQTNDDGGADRVLVSDKNIGRCIWLKDRSGKLKPVEPADMKAVLAKIKG